MGNETILIAEDNDLVRKSAVDQLRKRGYQVLEAADGESALAMLKERGQGVDLLLTDVVMPGMSGKELADRLTMAFGSTKVLFVSGHASAAIVRYGVLEPGVHFLTKPYTISMLEDKIRSVLDES